MDDWERFEQDDFESRYADELEMLDDLEEEDPQPISKRRLSFCNDKRGDIGVVGVSTGHNIVSVKFQAKKRDCNEMFLPLSDVEESGFDDWNSDSAPCKKRARLSLGENGKENHDTGHQLPILENERSPLRQLQSKPLLSHDSKSISIEGKLLPRLEKRKVFRRPPMSCEAVTITRMDGQRLYLSVRADKEDETSSANSKGMNKKLYRGGLRNSLQLLSVPFSVLREHVLEERRRRVMEESEVTMSLNRPIDESGIAELQPLMHSNDIEMNKEDEKLLQHALWVEKYTPRYFTELLSDDAINRILLTWLKLWDKTVFGKGLDKKKKPKPEQNKKNNQTKKFKKHWKGTQEEADWNALDVTGRPVCKVALLCGSPGLGKTTLAHVIAQHAGYNVVEMNASDDRSPEVFRNTLEASTQMKSVLGYNEKPNCLVIDEIDGAPAPAINVLLSVIKQKDSDAASAKKTKRKKKASPLSRPIICICNDQYAPALRQLRQVAFLVAFPPTIPARLTARLLEISRQESINTDITTLTALCEKTDSDVRSCLNTLQFIHKRHGRVWLEHVQTVDIGQKDSHRSLFSVWQEIFQLPRPKRKRFAAYANNENQNSSSCTRDLLSNDILAQNARNVGDQRRLSAVENRFHNVLHSAMSSGQYEKVAQGLFENYLQVKFKDPNLEVVVSGTEWLEFTDFIDQAVLRRQSYNLMAYNPFLSVAFHFFFATAQSNSKLSYPNSQYENHQKETKTKNLVQGIKSESAPHIRQNLNLRTACLELLPFMLDVITPTLRPVNTQLFSTREKQQLVELIDTMIGYNLTYHQERNFEGQYTYVLDPNIEEAVKFPGLPQHRQLTYATKQLISREIELEKMRRAERNLKNNGVNGSCPGRISSNYKNTKATKPNNTIAVFDTKAKPREVKPALDFFGRPITIKSQTADKEKSDSRQSKPSHIWFRFNEGYSNAVRKSVKVQEFL
ncbi:chromosome transmission fidelity protein 18 homolog isoform X3 [Acropora millepora]|uniref:chromosome transmission fidelity protein 18 homolog isoform X3 n=1 Tax=Acropora millepora TaxID=45264 RepID=UPI001CF2EE85|nr:chromosome transmission fidelity protein 18 homolog isoform X3 [Acropora millepora]